MSNENFNSAEVGRNEKILGRDEAIEFLSRYNIGTETDLSQLSDLRLASELEKLRWDRSRKVKDEDRSHWHELLSGVRKSYAYSRDEVMEFLVKHQVGDKSDLLQMPNINLRALLLMLKLPSDNEDYYYQLELRDVSRESYTVGRSEVIEFLLKHGSGGMADLSKMSDDNLYGMLRRIKLTGFDDKLRSILESAFSSNMDLFKNSESKREGQAVFVETNPASMDDPYLVLGVTKESPFEDIRQAYYKLVRDLHPDKVDLVTEAREDIALLRSLDIVPEILKDNGYNITDQKERSSFLAEMTLYPWGDNGENYEVTIQDLSRYALGQILIDAKSEMWIFAKEFGPIHGFVTGKPIPFESPRFKDKLSEDVCNKIINLSKDNNFLSRVEKMVKDYSLRYATLERFKESTYSSLLRVREAWDQIKSSLRENEIDHMLLGFDWIEDVERIDHYTYSRSRQERETLARIETLKIWGAGEEIKDIGRLADEGERERRYEQLVWNEDLFHKYVPTEVQPEDYGVRVYTTKYISLENGAKISLDLPYHYDSGKKFAVSDYKAEPQIIFYKGPEVLPGEFIGGKQIDVKHLVIMAHRQAGKELTPGFFRDIADEFLFSDDQIRSLAKEVTAFKDLDSVISDLGFVIPKYLDKGDKKELINLEDFSLSNQTIEEQIREYEKLKKSLEVFYEKDLVYVDDGDLMSDSPYRSRRIKLNLNPSGSWSLVFYVDQRLDSDDSEDIYTLSKDETQLLVSMVSGPALK